MASIVSCIVAGTTWCFCSAAASLLGSCCGNDKNSTVSPGAASGRKRSVLLLFLAIAIAFAFQYGVAGMIVRFDISNYVTDAWLDGCDQYGSDMLIEQCAGQAGVYRSAFSALIFYVLAAIGVSCKRTSNREAWPAKYILFLFLVLAMCFVPNDPLFLKVYLNIARVGGILFVIVQQIIFVDLALNWNESWVEKSNAADAEEPDSGKKWLIAILICAATMFIASIVGWGLLFHYFGGCSTNTAFIAVTVFFSVLITGAQMSGEEGSLLASSMITAYATSLCYSAVAKNPNSECNPFLGEDDVLGIVIGVTLTLVSLGYAGWSSTADKTLSSSSDEADEKTFDYQNGSSNTADEKNKVTGVVANDYGTGEGDIDADADADEADGAGEESVPNNFSNNWRLNLILGIVTCWFSMALTAWGSIQSGGDAANPQVGEVSMWMIVGSQWFALLLYLWTLLAPRLLPDRDFS